MLTDEVDEEMFANCPRLVALSNYAVGYENIDVKAATRRGIPIGNTPDALTEATAQFAFSLALQLLRHVPEATAAVRDGRWMTWTPTDYLGRDFRDTTVGVIGYGRIGQAFAELAKAVGMNVLHTGGELTLHEVLSRADVVSLHVPLTSRSRGMIGASELAAMPRGSRLVNTSRGAVIDTDALVEAMERNHLGGVALDVTDPEPLPANHRLLKFDQVIVSPHIASATSRSRVGMAERAVANVFSALAGLRMPHCVNPEVYESQSSSGAGIGNDDEAALRRD